MRVRPKPIGWRNALQAQMADANGTRSAEIAVVRAARRAAAKAACWRRTVL